MTNPNPAPASPASVLADALVSEMLDWLQNGKPAVGPGGEPILDESGLPTQRKLTAQELDVIRKYVKDSNIGGLSAKNTPHDRLQQAARNRLGLTGTDPIPISKNLDDEGYPIVPE